MRGLFIGRFQPFHLGHLAAIRWILEQVDEVIIAIGSAQYSHSSENPFTSGERMEMIRLALKGVPRERYIIAQVSDTDGVHSTWVSLVLASVPKFDLVFTNNPLVKRLFKEKGFEVREVPLIKPKLYSATEIRRRILRKLKWKSLVPKQVFKLIKEIRGDERIVEIGK
jgi:nicotinamide-nucleotide adenylyltransferase